VIERIFGLTGSAGSAPRSPISIALSWFFTIHFVCLTWVFFRAPTFDASLDYFSTMFSGAGWGTTATPFVVVIFALGTLSHIIPPRWFETLETRYDTASLPFKVLLPFATIFLIAIAAPDGIAPFIYFQF
jgi:hypothetical protein